MVRENTFINDPIELKDERPAPWKLRDLTIVDNRIKDAGVVADGATVNNYRAENFRIDRNTYDNDDTLFHWGSRTADSLEDVRSKFGFEEHGKRREITFVPL
jgi:hypothetical protein